MKKFTARQKLTLIRQGVCFSAATSNPRVFLMFGKGICELVEVLP